MSISKKRMAEIAAIRDEDIDLSDIPEMGEDFFRRAKVRKMQPMPKTNKNNGGVGGVGGDG